MLQVALIAGHGGSDTGTTNGDITESVWAHGCVLRIRDMLKSSPCDIAVVRRIGETLSLAGRGQRIKESGAGLAVCIHVDEAEDESWQGALAFHWPNNWRGREVCKRIAMCMPDELRHIRPVQPATKDYWPRARNVLSFHPANCTSVLVEVGRASNEGDSKFLRSMFGVDQVAAAVVSGILLWCEQETENVRRNEG